MWPWQHAAVGYLGYALYCWYRQRVPSDGAVLALLVGTQFPDLVDKPLAWIFDVLPGGRSLAHSLVVAVPLCIAILLATRASSRAELGQAFTVGYLLHIPGDLLLSALLGDGLLAAFLFWPLVPHPAQGASGGPTLDEILASLVEIPATPVGIVWLAGEVTLVALAVVVWRRDGSPGSKTLRRVLPGNS